ncbi:MAG: hypothetical protein KIT31_12940 [Deltaproteobacteria bacterium]|nr:hypothetical protein [Deltaproteobacteria bacterium]
MDFLAVFETPILVFQVPGTDELNAALAAKLLDERARDPGLRVSNRGSWHSVPDLARRPDPAFRELSDMLGRHFLRATHELAQARGLPQVPPLKLALTAWAMVMDDGHYTLLHDHAAATWSSAYYVDAGDPPPPDLPDAGRLAFVDPRRAAPAVPGLDLFSGALDLPARTGQLVIFPGYLQHFVHPYRGTRPRISIGANAMIQVGPPA